MTPAIDAPNGKPDPRSFNPLQFLIPLVIGGILGWLIPWPSPLDVGQKGWTPVYQAKAGLKLTKPIELSQDVAPARTRSTVSVRVDRVPEPVKVGDEAGNVKVTGVKAGSVIEVDGPTEPSAQGRSFVVTVKGPDGSTLDSFAVPATPDDQTGTFEVQAPYAEELPDVDGKFVVRVHIHMHGYTGSFTILQS